MFFAKLQNNSTPSTVTPRKTKKSKRKTSPQPIIVIRLHGCWVTRCINCFPRYLSRTSPPPRFRNRTIGFRPMGCEYLWARQLHIRHLPQGHHLYQLPARCKPAVHKIPPNGTRIFFILSPFASNNSMIKNLFYYHAIPLPIGEVKQYHYCFINSQEYLAKWNYRSIVPFYIYLHTCTTITHVRTSAIKDGKRQCNSCRSLPRIH